MRMFLTFEMYQILMWVKIIIFNQRVVKLILVLFISFYATQSYLNENVMGTCKNIFAK